MANLAVLVPYQNLPARLTLAISSLLFPLWAILFPIWFCLFVILLFRIPGAVPPATAGVIIAVLSAVPALGLFATALCEDNRILISNAGLTFPISFLLGLKFKREFAWKDLTAIHLRWQGASNFERTDRIDLFFQNRGHATLWLQHLKRSDLEQLVLALRLWAGDHGDEHYLLELQTHLRGGDAEEKRLSITQLWEDELASKFGATSFTPLPVDSYLQSSRLRIVKTLGFGGCSAVYLAQLNGKQLVAVKEAAQQHLNDTQTSNAVAQLLDSEAAVLMQLSHPQIPRLFDHFVEQERHYIAIEYISGQDLRQLVRVNGPLGELDVINLVLGICDALIYLHQHSPAIIHSDITPENILLGRSGKVALIDFGSARQFGWAGQPIITGKKCYMAPEQFEGRFLPQSDIFSLGCTMYFLLTGQDPTAAWPISQDPLNVPLSNEMKVLLRRCTEPNVAERPSSVDILRNTLVQMRRLQADITPDSSEIAGT